jgi:hypothetical protein
MKLARIIFPVFIADLRNNITYKIIFVACYLNNSVTL